MNKLDVAVSLLQLLNERKTIDTKIVSNELNVSMRTAQRYLLELSRMPCVIFDEKSRTYSLNNDYKIKESLINGNSNYNNTNHNNKIPNTNHGMCLLCGANRNYFSKMLTTSNINDIFSNKNFLDKLISIIKKNLNGNKCSFP